MLASLRACGFVGPLQRFVAFGDMALLRPATRRQLSSTGVLLCDVPSGRKDAADRALLLDLAMWVRDTPPPATLLLITGDRDFAPAAHRMVQLGYTVLLAAPIATASVAPELLSAASRRFDWASLACGLVQFEERERARGAVVRMGLSAAAGSGEGGDAAVAAAAAEAQADAARRSAKARANQVASFVAAAAAAIEREDVAELARVVDAAQAAGLKTTREEALLADLRRKLKRRDASLVEVRARLERALADGDAALCESALLAARTAGVARAPALAPMLDAAARLVRASRRARRDAGRAADGGTPAAPGEDDEDDDDDEGGDVDGDEPPAALDMTPIEARAAASALAEHRGSSRRHQMLAAAGNDSDDESSDERDDSWAGHPWSSAAGATPAPSPSRPALSTAAAAAAATEQLDVDAVLASIDGDAAAPPWFAPLCRAGVEGCDLALLTSAVERGTAAGVDTAVAAALLALCARARSAAGSLLRAALTRKTNVLASLLASLRGGASASALAKLMAAELAEARDALATLLAQEAEVEEGRAARVPQPDWDSAAHNSRVAAALAAEDAAELRAALLDGALRGGEAADETQRSRLKSLLAAVECAAELRRAAAAGDAAVLRARLARARKDYLARHAGRTFPTADGVLLADITAASAVAEAALAALPPATDDADAAPPPAASAGVNGHGGGHAHGNGNGSAAVAIVGARASE